MLYPLSQIIKIMFRRSKSTIKIYLRVVEEEVILAKAMDKLALKDILGNN
jgi:hypothetical protein